MKGASVALGDTWRIVASSASSCVMPLTSALAEAEAYWERSTLERIVMAFFASSDRSRTASMHTPGMEVKKVPSLDGSTRRMAVAPVLGG